METSKTRREVFELNRELLPEGLKFCKRCEKSLSIELFRPQKGICKECEKIKGRERDAIRRPHKNPGQGELVRKNKELKLKGLKFCPLCNQEKKLSHFSISPKGKVNSRCRSCHSVESLEKHHAKKAPRLKARTERRANNIKLKKEGLKCCRSCDEVKPLELFAFADKKTNRYATDCLECRKKNAKPIKPETLKAKAKRKKVRMNTDPVFNLQITIRGLISKMLARKGFSKTSKTGQILGMNFDEFFIWLQSVSLAHPETDKVHIDHVIPQDIAVTEEEVLALNHFSNFQWLTEGENLDKGNRFTKQENFQRVLENHPNPKLIQSIVSKAGHKII